MGTKGRHATPDDPAGSPVMEWIRDHRNYQGDDCLKWPFYTVRTGYGRLGGFRGRKPVYAHRFICETVHGAPPSPEYHAAHSCGNGHLGCVNPRHLSWKTPSANGREGRKHPKYKLTASQAIEIWNSTERSDVLAARYGVAEPSIRRVKTGETWGRVTSAHPSGMRAGQGE